MTNDYAMEKPTNGWPGTMLCLVTLGVGVFCMYLGIGGRRQNEP